jgi:putative copper export protein
MLQRFFTVWLQNHPASTVIRESVWIYAFDQAIHLTALAVFAGAILVVDLRLLGGGFKNRPVAQVARDAQPWLVGAFIVLTITGVVQMMSNATKEYFSPFFWFKMYVLIPAFIYTFTIRWKVATAAEGRVSPVVSKLVGLISILLWTGVTVPARLIGLLS